MDQVLREILLWTWCLPQTVLGAVVAFVNGMVGKTVRVEQFRGHSLIRVRKWTWLAGISLGRFVFVHEKRFDAKTINHEFAHTTQSYWLGPFYLIIIGIPSILLAVRTAFQPSFKKQYLCTWPESWTERIREREEKEGKGYGNKSVSSRFIASRRRR